MGNILGTVQIQSLDTTVISVAQMFMLGFVCSCLTSLMQCSQTFICSSGSGIYEFIGLYKVHVDMTNLFFSPLIKC